MIFEAYTVCRPLPSTTKCNYTRKHTHKRLRLAKDRNCDEKVRSNVFANLRQNKGRFSQYDNTARRFFKVSRRNLAESDSGKYWCVVNADRIMALSSNWLQNKVSKQCHILFRLIIISVVVFYFLCFCLFVVLCYYWCFSFSDCMREFLMAQGLCSLPVWGHSCVLCCLLWFSGILTEKRNFKNKLRCKGKNISIKCH